MRPAFVPLSALAIFVGGCVGDISDGDDDDDDDDVTVADAGPGDDTDADPNAPDGGGVQAFCYQEDGDPTADISDLVAAYGGSNWKDELIEAMDRRHPATGFLLDEQRNDSYFSQFSDSSSWTGMVGWLDTLSHEETHLFNAYHAADVGEAAAIYARPDLIFYLPADDTFGRAEIYDDLAAAPRDGIYAPTYLTGSQGQRGFNALLDELSCYLNEMAAVGLVGEYFSGGVSLRDGSVAFLYFMQVYLRVARTEYPDVYDDLKSQEAYRDVVFMLWLRTHYFLEFADEFPSLGISDAMYRSHMYEPANLAEIEMFTGHAVGDSSCEL